MYAKLVATANVNPCLLIRDIVRLCTSDTPNTTLISGFSNTSSVVIDPTPAGWTYVYSTADTTTLQPASNATINNTTAYEWWAMSAPCLGPLSGNATLKYAKLTTVGAGTANSIATNTLSGFALTGAANIQTSSVTNEGTRRGANSTSAASFPLYAWGSATYHLIATPRHVTLIREGYNYQGVWEYAFTDVHSFYTTSSPFLQINHGGENGSNNTTSAANTGPADPVYTTTTAFNTQSNISNLNTQNFGSYTSCLFNVTVPSTGVSYGSLSLGIMQNMSMLTANNLLAFQPYLFNYGRLSSVNSTGATRNLLNPIFINGGSIGHPTLDVSTTSKIYNVKAGIASTGDNIDINGTTYTFFNSGTSSNNGLALVMTTS